MSGAETACTVRTCPARIAGTGRREVSLAMDIAHIDTAELVGELLGHAPLAVAWKDPDHVSQGCNEAFAQLVGVAAPEELVGRQEEDLPLYGADDGAAFGRDERVLRTGRTVNSVDSPGSIRTRMQSYNAAPGPKQHSWLSRTKTNSLIPRFWAVGKI